MKRKTVKKTMPKAQAGRAVKKAGEQIERAENKAKQTVKGVVKSTADAAKKADDWMEKNLRLITQSPQYKASKYVIKKMLK